MANSKVIMNCRQKLAQARLEFLNQNVKKSGKNMHLEFKYFELEDIIPSAIKIFAALGILTTTNIDGDLAVMSVYNAEDMNEEPVIFSVPYREIEPIISNSGKQVTNSLQALGSSITYLRRYLYMMVLDIVEHDDIDANIGSEEPAAEEPKKAKAPATTEERKAAKEELTADKSADDAQITELKTLCKTLLEKDEKMEDFIQEIALKTEGFTKITSTACKALNENIQEMIKSYGGES